MNLIDITDVSARQPANGNGTDPSGRLDIDVLGVGFGPSNMALAIALDEHNRSQPQERQLRAMFLERERTTSWHRHMLFEDASMQVAFAKDLVTFRNPQSRFSFLQFLVDHDRIADFFNRGSMMPLRTEFSAYVQWAAGQLSRHVTYDACVTRLEPVLDHAGTVVGFEVLAAVGGRIQRYRARHVVLAAGLQPVMPCGVLPGPRVWHTAEFLARVADLPAGARTFAVAGGGQSAAEAVLHLHGTFPGAVVHGIHSGYGYVTSDMTPYANRIFDPQAVDEFFHASEEVRSQLFARHLNTNYSSVNPRTIDRIFDADYADRCAGRRRLLWHKACRVTGVDVRADGVDVHLFSQLDGAATTLHVDALVCGTGYRPTDPKVYLGGSHPIVRRDECGRPVVNRDYSAVLTTPSTARLYLVGQTNHSHGISSTLLSNIAVRAGELVDSIVEAQVGAAADQAAG